MEFVPVTLERTQTGIEIEWNDGRQSTYRAAQLRKICPCATCREKNKSAESAKPAALPVLSLAEAKPLSIERMRPVGNYAYNITFSDGHDSGLFTFEMLYELGEPETPAS